MKYTKMILRKYSRIKLNMIDTIEIDFTNPINIILGCNGSGKTSIVGELLQLVGYHQDFGSNGYKSVELISGSSTYVVIADFSEKKPHSFLQDGVNLNPGGTISVQLELVKMHFGIDSEIVDLLIGRLRFTRMSAAKRKDIIMRMSGQVLDYALSAHDLTKMKTRDLKGVISHLKSRSMQLSKKLDELSERVDMHRIETINSEISKCTELMDPSVGVNESYDKRRDACLATLKELEVCSKDLLETRAKGALLRHRLKDDIKDEFSLDESISKHTSTSHHLDQKAIELMNEQDQITRDILEKNKHGDVVQLNKWKEEKTSLESSIASLRARIRTFKFDSIPTDTPSAKEVKDELLGALNNIPNNEDGRYSRIVLNKAKNELLSYESRKITLSQSLRRNTIVLDDLNQVKETKCPKCKYVYREGVTEAEIEKYEKLVAIDSESIRSIDKEIDTTTETIKQIEEYASALNELIKLKVTYPIGNLLNELIKEDGFKQSKETTVPVALTWVSDYEIALELKDKVDELERLNYKLGVAEQYVDKAMDDLTTKSRSLEDSAQDIQASLISCRENLSLLNELRKLHIKEDTLVIQLDKLGVRLTEEYNSAIATSKTGWLRHVVRLNMVELSLYKNDINERASSMAILDEMNSQLIKAEEEYVTFKLLASLLSPVDGIIAKTVGGFLHHMCKQINETIGHVFTYNLTVNVSSTDLLDYKFPLHSSNQEKAPKDVSLGSDGQMEIVDFAFKLVAMRQLGLSGYPLVLDEPGRTMDEVHQSNLMGYIKVLMDSHRHSQCLFISHFAFASGVFKDANYIVLNPSNITVPGEYNTNVIIT